jgi:hypothetical protein
MKNTRLIAAMAVAMVATGCGGGSDSDSSTGAITLRITDAPVDRATAVVVAFSGVELQRAGGVRERIEFTSPITIDLLQTQNGNAETLLANRTIPAGDYQWIRLLVNAAPGNNDSYIDLIDGRRFPLFVPSGAQSGLQLVRGFTVAQGSLVDFTIDFDLRKSVFAPPGLAGNYILRPALRIVDNNQVGVISGTVFPELLTVDCAPGVYVYAGSDSTPGDMGTTAVDASEPLASVRVDEATATYAIHYIAAGEYTVAFTCDSDLDIPDEYNAEVEFPEIVNVTVTANQTTTVNFPVSD